MDNDDVSIRGGSDEEQRYFPQPLWDPTPLKIVRRMLELAQVRSGDIVYDLGCGDARILTVAVQEFGAEKAVGYEINQSLYEQSMQNIQRQNLQNRITLVKDNLVHADLSEASVITLFLSMAANEYLQIKLEREAKAATRIVSYFHPMTAWQPYKTKGPLEDRLYLYVIPQAFQPVRKRYNHL